MGAALAAAALAIAAAACGGGGGGDNTATPDAAGSPPPPAPTRVPLPTVTGDRVTSNGIGYEASIPNGWRLSASFIQSPEIKGDAYFLNEVNTPTPERGTVNIAVTCEILEGERTLDDEIKEQQEALELLRRENIRLTDHAAVAGNPAKQFDYVFRLRSNDGTPEATPLPAVVRDERAILFLTQGCIWKITLSTPVGEIDQYAPVLDAFLASFTPTQ